jgi:hypothetical protein
MCEIVKEEKLGDGFLRQVESHEGWMIVASMNGQTMALSVAGSAPKVGPFHSFRQAKAIQPHVDYVFGALKNVVVPWVWETTIYLKDGVPVEGDPHHRGHETVFKEGAEDA